MAKTEWSGDQFMGPSFLPKAYYDIPDYILALPNLRDIIHPERRCTYCGCVTTPKKDCTHCGAPRE